MLALLLYLVVKRACVDSVAKIVTCLQRVLMVSIRSIVSFAMNAHTYIPDASLSISIMDYESPGRNGRAGLLRSSLVRRVSCCALTSCQMWALCRPEAGLGNNSYHAISRMNKWHIGVDLLPKGLISRCLPARLGCHSLGRCPNVFILLVTGYTLSGDSIRIAETDKIVL